jgi:hypothetical protein
MFNVELKINYPADCILRDPIKVRPTPLSNGLSRKYFFA